MDKKIGQNQANDPVITNNLHQFLQDMKGQLDELVNRNQTNNLSLADIKCLLFMQNRLKLLVNGNQINNLSQEDLKLLNELNDKINKLVNDNLNKINPQLNTGQMNNMNNQVMVIINNLLQHVKNKLDALTAKKDSLSQIDIVDVKLIHSYLFTLYNYKKSQNNLPQQDIELFNNMSDMINKLVNNNDLIRDLSQLWSNMECKLDALEAKKNNLSSDDITDLQLMQFHLGTFQEEKLSSNDDKERWKKINKKVNELVNHHQNNINSQQLQNNNINMVTDGSPNFTGIRIDGKYLREQEDNYSIDDILAEMNPSLNKKQFYIAVNTRIRQLAIEIQTATENFELKKQQDPSYNNQNEQVAIVKKMKAVRDLSRIIKFYFKERSEKDAKQCRDYTNIDCDGLNGWIPAYTDLNGQNHPGRLSFWDPINHSAIDIKEEELADIDIPFLGHDNEYSNCWFNAFNSMISHIPSFYLYFLKLGERISVKSMQEQDNIKNKFPLSYEIAMYMNRVNDLKSSGKQYHETLNFAQKVVQILNLLKGMNDVDDYKQRMMLTLDNELGISVSKNLPRSSEIVNTKNSISVYTFSCESGYSSPIYKMFYTTSVNITKCKSDQSHVFVNFAMAGNGYKFENCQDRFGQKPTLSKLLTHFCYTETFTGYNQQYCDGCRGNRDTDSAKSEQLFSSESTLTVISIQPQNNLNGPYSSNNPKQIKRPKKMPAFVKSGNNYFELISIGTHLHKGHHADGSFDHAHWVSYVKDVKNNQWHFCDDTHIDGKGNYSSWENKHQEFITNNINQILQNTSTNGANYVYKKCDKSKYNNAGNNIKEDISELAFDKNGKGITKSPLYLISAKAKNYALQKDNPTDEEFKSAVGSFKSRLQDQNVGILDQNGQIKKELISGKQDFIINNDFIGNNTIKNNLYNNDNNDRVNEVYQSYTSSAENTTGRRAVFIFSAIFAVAAIIFAIVGTVLAIKALTTAFIIAAILAVVLFFAGCFYNSLRKAVEACLPGVRSGNNLDYIEQEDSKTLFVSKSGVQGGDDIYGDPNIDNGNSLYESK